MIWAKEKGNLKIVFFKLLVDILLCKNRIKNFNLFSNYAVVVGYINTMKTTFLFRFLLLTSFFELQVYK